MKPNSIINYLRSAIRNPLEELSHWERLIRYIWNLTRQGARQLSEDRASMMAASLTYRTLFGMLPVTVVGAGVARTIMGSERFENFLQDSISAVGLDKVQIDTTNQGAEITLGNWLSDIVSSGMNVSIAALTWVGLLILVYSAIALLVDIESCCNIIYRAKNGRPWMKRIPIYWFVLTFGPVLIGVAFWADNIVDVFFTKTIPWDWLHWSISKCWDFSLGWVALVMLYKVIPTVRVQTKSAMIGAFVSALLLIIGKESLGLYFNHAMSLRHLYGSLGLVPVFMFWLYLMWLIILLGLQISAITQHVALKTVSRSNK